MSTAIEFENISKQYRLGLVSTKTLSHDIRRFWITNVLGKEDPYLKIGETNDRSTKGSSEYVWALRDINFKVEQGDVVGIIGKNGAGKSTLLKLLSKVTGPTTGTIRARGRIGSLLEVGTGFHPEMTGRENIFLNGAILGMTKQEIAGKLDEIVDFSGCERYIDTPVKRYSSGMMVRLGFAVAAHLDPEILVVDEVLAVGDAEFQKKAIGKMQDVSKGEGRTVLFVSHNMGSVRALCHSGIILENGRVKYIGTADDAVGLYIQDNYNENISHAVISNKHRDGEVNKFVEFVEAEMLNDVNEVSTDEDLRVRLKLRRNNPKIKECTIGMHIVDQMDETVGTSVSPLISIPDKNEFEAELVIHNHNLVKGRYRLYFNAGIKDVSAGVVDYDVVKNVLVFNIEFLSKNPKRPYALWQSGWGKHNLIDVDYSFK